MQGGSRGFGRKRLKTKSRPYPLSVPAVAHPPPNFKGEKGEVKPPKCPTRQSGLADTYIYLYIFMNVCKCVYIHICKYAGLETRCNNQFKMASHLKDEEPTAIRQHELCRLTLFAYPMASETKGWQIILCQWLSTPTHPAVQMFDRPGKAQLGNWDSRPSMVAPELGSPHLGHGLLCTCLLQEAEECKAVAPSEDPARLDAATFRRTRATPPLSQAREA